MARKYRIAAGQQGHGVDEGDKDQANVVQLPKEGPVAPAGGDVQYQRLTLLPQLRFTLPLLLAALTLWLAWVEHWRRGV